MNNYIIRKAQRQDIPAIVKLLADDALGSVRESYQEPLPECYYQAFNVIANEKNNYLMIIEDENIIIGTFQLTILTYLTYKGGKRGQIEGVRINKNYRSQGIGKMMIQWGINRPESGYL